MNTLKLSNNAIYDAHATECEIRIENLKTTSRLFRMVQKIVDQPRQLQGVLVEKPMTGVREQMKLSIRMAQLLVHEDTVISRKQQVVAP